MRPKIIVAVLFGALAVAGLAAFYLQQPGFLHQSGPKDVTADYARGPLQGIWKAVEVYKDGRTSNEEVGSLLTFSGNEVTFMGRAPKAKFVDGTY